MRALLVGAAYLGASLAVHLALVQVSVTPARPRASRPPAVVRMSAAPAKVAEPIPPPKPVSKPVVAPKPKRVPLTPQPEPVVPEPGEPAPAELTGSTLVGTGVAAWSAPVGSGEARDGGIGAGLSRSVLPEPVAATATVAALPASVPLAQLSRKPVPPALGAALERNYPERARRQGQSGDAKVRARIEPSGEVRAVSISSETAPGFGEACRRTLLGSRWTAPLNDAGRPVATWVSYRCKFRVDD